MPGIQRRTRQFESGETSGSSLGGSPDLLDLEFEKISAARSRRYPVVDCSAKALFVRRASFRGRVVVPEPLLYRLSRPCTKTVQRERQSESIRERELLDRREEILTPDLLIQ